METGPRTRPRAAVLGALLAMYATSPGQTFVISGYNESLCAATDAAEPGLGLAPTTLSASYLVGTLLSAACLTHAGKLADRIGPRRMIALAGVGLAIAGLLFSNAAGLVTLTAAFFALRFTGQGTLALASSHALALRFDAKLGSVEGLRGATISAAIATAPLIAVSVIGSVGWRNAAWILTSAAGALAVFAAYGLLDRDPPADHEPDAPRASETAPRPQAGHTLAEARRTPAFWIVVGCTAFMAAHVTAVHFHLQPLLRPRGMDETAAAATFAPFAALGVVTTLVGGVLVDRFSAAPILGWAMLCLGAGGACLGWIETAWAAHAGMAIVGTGHGLATAVAAPTLARYFGRAHHGAIRGASGTLAVAGSAAGPYGLSALATGTSGSFGTALLVASALAVPFAWAAFRLQRPAPPTVEPVD